MKIKGNLRKMEQKDLIKRLSDYIEYDALTKPASFAKEAGIDPSGFSKMLKGMLI